MSGAEVWCYFGPGHSPLRRAKEERPISTINLYFLRLFLFLCAALPLRFLHGLARLWGRLLYVLPSRAKDTTHRNLAACFPERSAAEIDGLTCDSLQHTACTALEMGKSWLWPMAKLLPLVTETEGMEAFNKAVASKEGLLLLAPHLGNWEIFGYYTATTTDAVFMYQPPKLPALDNLLRKTRSRGGIELAPANRQGVAQLLRKIQRGGLVGLLPDQVPTDGGGIHGNFFGHPALTMTLVSKLLARKKVPVFCGFAERLPGGRGFRVIVQEAHPQIYSADLAESVAGLNLSVEACVRRAIPQYQWEYKRFRRQPDGRKFY